MRYNNTDQATQMDVLSKVDRLIEKGRLNREREAKMNAGKPN